MNYDRQKAFPYPVLRPNSDDFAGVDFQATVRLTVGRGKVHARFEYRISSDEIVQEINKGNAEVVCIISCRDTYYREVIASSELEAARDFGTNNLRGEVRIDPYVVARKRISNFSSPDIYSEFGSGPFEYNPGDVLAQDEPQVFYVDRELFKPVTSVFELVKKDELTDKEWRIGFEEDHVQIEVSSNVKEVFDNARNSSKNRAVLLNSIYFAAVMQAVQKLKTSEGEFEGRKWADVILRQASNKGCSLESQDAYEVAQELMHYPLLHLRSLFTEGV